MIQFVQRDHQYELLDGTFEIVCGLEFLPFDIFGFIDDLIDQISKPFASAIFLFGEEGMMVVGAWDNLLDDMRDGTSYSW